MGAELFLSIGEFKRRNSADISALLSTMRSPCQVSKHSFPVVFASPAADSWQGKPGFSLCVKHSASFVMPLGPHATSLFLDDDGQIIVTVGPKNANFLSPAALMRKERHIKNEMDIHGMVPRWRRAEYPDERQGGNTNPVDCQST